MKRKFIKCIQLFKDRIVSFFKKTPKKKLIFFCGIILLCIPLLIGFSTFSRYVTKSIYNNFLLSKKFFFYSDTLNGETHVLNDWDGKHEYILTVDVRNYIDELRWTNVPINYEVEVSCDSNIAGNVSCAASNGTLNYNVNGGTANQINIIVTNPNNLEFSDTDYVDMHVEITSTDPYKKTLSTDYRLNINVQDIEFSILDSVDSEYADLIISNYSVDNDITSLLVGWDYTLLSVDRTNEYILDGTKRTTTVNGHVYINGYYIDLSSKTSTTIRFYKKDKTQNYTNTTNAITVEKQIS